MTHFPARRLAVLAFMLAACTQPTSVDGWPLGSPIPCAFQASTPAAAAVVAKEFTGRFGAAVAASHTCFYPGPCEVDGNPVM